MNAYDHSYTSNGSPSIKVPKDFWLWSYDDFAEGVYFGTTHGHFIDYVLMNPN